MRKICLIQPRPQCPSQPPPTPLLSLTPSPPQRLATYSSTGNTVCSPTVGGAHAEITKPIRFDFALLQSTLLPHLVRVFPSPYCPKWEIFAYRDRRRYSIAVMNSSYLILHTPIRFNFHTLGLGLLHVICCGSSDRPWILPRRNYA